MSNVAKTINRLSPPVSEVSALPLRVAESAPDHATAWDAYVKGHADGTLFHTSGWRNAVALAFRHEAHYLVATRGDAVVGVLPMFLVASRLAGRLLVSVPYGVGGGILADDPSIARLLFDHAREIATSRRCAAIDLRSERAVLPDVDTVDGYAGFRATLPAQAEDVLGWLPRKARAAARNGRQKFGLTISYGDEHLPEVWRLYALSMRRLASLNYPFSFFRSLITETPGRHWVSLVRWRGRPVAGLVTFLHNDRVMPYFIGTTDEARACSAANYIYLATMERAVAAGYRVFDFGRSRFNNKGSFDFKRLQGFEPRTLGYQLHTLPGHVRPDLNPSSGRFKLARAVWRRLPLVVTKSLGARIARHVTG